MSLFLSLLLEHHKKNKLRSRNFHFFKACMAASAMVAIADGNACRREGKARDILIKTLKELELYDPKHGVDLYNEYLDDLETDADKGRDRIMAAIDEIKGDARLTALLVAVCHTISEADGRVLPSEVDVISHICGHLGIDPASVEAVEVDIRSEMGT